jgi:hypothetical protein
MVTCALKMFEYIHKLWNHIKVKDKPFWVAGYLAMN